ncbi:MAG: AMP-binding protein, partial [Clostridia bacterium]|nr:AMP-binding protein [Clostridia bacterium]
NVSLHNLYGPTECAVDVTCYDCRPEDVDPVPIGKPVYNTQIHITDKYLNPVPIGVQGEICIAGMNVGQGYLNKPELTAEKFVDNPFGEGKLYKTGDIGYWREDGNVVFVGRKDSQIKLNGQRIELGEIEAVINSVSGVSSSAVIVKNVNGADILAAFFTGEAEASYVKEACSVKLPSYMLPTAFIHLDKLPLNSSGKLDRKALSVADIELSFEEFSEPENETEKLICEMFSRVLNVENVGRNSDFFRIGGTSLSMISILSEDAFAGVTAADFIRNSTPARLARILAKTEEKSLSYLEPLYKADNAEKALILFPYAGGGAEAFSKLVSDFTKKNKDASVYFVRYLHSFEECEKAADEIINTLGGKNISVYSHCVGAAVALQIIKILEDRKVPVKHYFAGAVIPPSRPNGKNVWNKVSDGMLKAILIKAGAPLNNLPENEVSDLLKRFREDTDFANASFAQMKEKINTPVRIIISKRDLFTVNYMQTAKLWKRYAENPAAIYFMDSKNHYFQSSSTEKIIVILQKYM